MLPDRFQDEEEVPPESGSEGKDEDSKDKGQKDEAPKEKQEQTEKSEPEEKSQEKKDDAGSNTDDKVRTCHIICAAHLIIPFVWETLGIESKHSSVLVKEEKDGEKPANAEAEKEAEKKAKPQKKSKISEDIAVELIINDILNPTADDLSSSKKK